MRRVVYRETGDPDVLRLVDEPTPEPGRAAAKKRAAEAGVVGKVLLDVADLT